MGDFERTFGAGADAVEIVEALSRGKGWPPKRNPSRKRGLSPEERQEMERKQAERVALAGSVNKLTLIGVVITPPAVKRSGIIYASFDMATWEPDWMSSGEATHHSVSVDDERLFDLVEKEVSPGTRVYVEGMLRKAPAVASMGMPERVFVSIRKIFGRLVVLDHPGLEVVPKDPFADTNDGTIPF